MLGGSGGRSPTSASCSPSSATRAPPSARPTPTRCEILEKAQISPLGFAGFFKRVEGRERARPLARSAIFRTHPLSAERARLAASRPAYPATPALSESDWRALREICAGFRPATSSRLPASARAIRPAASCRRDCARPKQRATPTSGVRDLMGRKATPTSSSASRPRAARGKGRRTTPKAAFSRSSAPAVSKARLALVQAQPPYPVNPVLSDGDW